MHTQKQRPSWAWATVMLLCCLSALADCSGAPAVPRGVLIASQVRNTGTGYRLVFTKDGERRIYDDYKTFAIARDNSARQIAFVGTNELLAIPGDVPVPSSICYTVDLFGYAISPKGDRGACIDTRDVPGSTGHDGRLVVFSIRRMKPVSNLGKVHLFINGPHSLAFQEEDVIRGLMLDRRSCRAGDEMYPTRLVTVELRSGRVTKGPCTLTVPYSAVGPILTRMDNNYKRWEFSTDGGKTWRYGNPQVILPGGEIYFLTLTGDLIGPSKKRIADHIVYADWARW